MATSVRVAAVGDLHCTKASLGALQALFSRIAESTDVLVMCGDLTDRGQPDEARVLAKELQGSPGHAARVRWPAGSIPARGVRSGVTKGNGT